MKKTLMAIALSGAALFLVACTDDPESEVAPAESIGATELNEVDVTEVEIINNTDFDYEEFETKISDDNILETEDYKLELLSVEIIKSPMESSKGLYLTYNLTNKLNDNIIPSDVLNNYVIIEQTTDTSVVGLQNNYYETDAFGDDPDTYNMMVDKGNSMNNQLLPGKTIEAYQAVYLEDESLPIAITVLDLIEFLPIETYEVELK